MIDTVKAIGQTYDGAIQELIIEKRKKEGEKEK